MPFVLHSQPTAVYEGRSDLLAKMAWTAHRRYAEILRDVEELINDHSQYLEPNQPDYGTESDAKLNTKSKAHRSDPS